MSLNAFVDNTSSVVRAARWKQSKRFADHCCGLHGPWCQSQSQAVRSELIVIPRSGLGYQYH
eukprot:6187462-Pleurochrysis_carterae.AAC.4